jgi:hypothetical protein
MYLPIDFQVDIENESKCYILKLNKSLYVLKQASLNWFEKLKQGLTDCGFHPSVINPCLTGFAITYATFPIYWASCFQTENALSTAKAEYITICVTQSDTTYDTYGKITSYLSSAHKQTKFLL